MLDNVSMVEFRSNEVPEVTFNRLNEHYQGVVALSRLILRHSAFQAMRGEIRANGFLMDMNVVFQEFVMMALRESQVLLGYELSSEKEETLDEAGAITMRPDLSWWKGNQCVFVADAKYKRTKINNVPNADLYQLLAYITALDLPCGMLIYAQGESDTATYTVRNAGKLLWVDALDLSGSIETMIESVDSLASKIATRGMAQAQISQLAA